ncbi:MAG: thymidine phosphorylase, partial [Candidatus Altarchaeaceae archaeon]
MKLKSKILNIESGNFVVLMNEEDAKEIGISLVDRVKISFDSNTVIAIPNFTNSTIKKGEIGIYEEVREILNIKDNDIVDVSIADRPISLEYIRKKLDGENLNDFEIRAI